MCDYCSDDPKVRKSASDYDNHTAELLERLSTDYRQIASGRIKPHTDPFTKESVIARAVIRRLVEQWL